MNDLVGKPRRPYGRLILLALLVAGAIALIVSGAMDYASVERLTAHKAELLAFVAAHRAIAILAYMAIYFAGVALSVPGWGIFAVVGGLLFGPLVGTIIVLVSATLGGVVVVLAARYIAGDALRARVAPAIRALEAGFRENAMSYLIALRLVSVLPFALTTLAVAFLGVQLRTFIIATAVGIAPATIILTTLGAGLGRALDATIADPFAAARQPEVILGLSGLALLALLPVAYKKLKRR